MGGTYSKSADYKCVQTNNKNTILQIEELYDKSVQKSIEAECKNISEISRGRPNNTLINMVEFDSYYTFGSLRLNVWYKDANVKTRFKLTYFQVCSLGYLNNKYILKCLTNYYNPFEIEEIHNLIVKEWDGTDYYKFILDRYMKENIHMSTILLFVKINKRPITDDNTNVIVNDKLQFYKFMKRPEWFHENQPYDKTPTKFKQSKIY